MSSIHNTILSLKRGIKPTCEEMNAVNDAVWSRRIQLIKDGRNSSFFHHEPREIRAMSFLLIPIAKRFIAGNPSAEFLESIGLMIDYLMNKSTPSAMTLIDRYYGELYKDVCNISYPMNKPFASFSNLNKKGYIGDDFISVLLKYITIKSGSKSLNVGDNKMILDLMFIEIIYELSVMFGVFSPHISFNKDFIDNEMILQAIEPCFITESLYWLNRKKYNDRNKIFILNDDLMDALKDTDLDYDSPIEINLPFDEFSVRFSTTINSNEKTYRKDCELRIAKSSRMKELMMERYGEVFGCHDEEYSVGSLSITTILASESDVMAELCFIPLNVGKSLNDIYKHANLNIFTPRDVGKKDIDAISVEQGKEMHALIFKILMFLTNYRVLELIKSTPDQERGSKGKIITRPLMIQIGLKKRYIKSGYCGNIQNESKIVDVRGHFKMQAHGEGRVYRKRIWIMPYIRGMVENNEDQIYIVKS